MADRKLIFVDYATKVVEALCEDSEVAEVIIDALNTLPHVELLPQWIPCSIRLPEKDGMYYVTVRDSKGDIDAVPCLWFFDKWGINGFDVIAWIKIPEPYRGE